MKSLEDSTHCRMTVASPSSPYCAVDFVGAESSSAE